MPAADDLAVTNQHGSDRNTAFAQPNPGFVYRGLKKLVDGSNVASFTKHASRTAGSPNSNRLRQSAPVDSSDSVHQQWMTEAIMIGRAGMQENGGGPFGAVIVRDGQLVGRGWNQVTRNLDPTAHAEVTAIREACRELARFDLRGCDLYTSCEPCPMCLAAIYWARVDRIFFGCTRTDAAAAGFDDEFLYQQIGLEHSARSLPMAQIGREAAMQLFADWAVKPDKIPY